MFICEHFALNLEIFAYICDGFALFCSLTERLRLTIRLQKFEIYIVCDFHPSQSKQPTSQCYVDLEHFELNVDAIPI